MAELKTRRMRGETAEQERERRQLVYNGIYRQALQRQRADVVRGVTGVSQRTANRYARDVESVDGWRRYLRLAKQANSMSAYDDNKRHPVYQRVENTTGVKATTGNRASTRAERLASAVSVLYDAPQPRGGLGTNS